MDAQLIMVVISHLNDAMIELGTDDPDTRKTGLKRLKFVKYLNHKYLDREKRVHPDAEWEKFLEGNY